MPAAKPVRPDAASVNRSRLRLKGAGQASEGKRQSASASDLAEITIARDSLETLRQHKGAVRKMLTSYAGAVEKAERLGQSVEVVIKVSPAHAESTVEARPADGDALDFALSAARQRGAVRVAEILQSADMLTARDFGALIGASHETVNQKRKTGDILALEGARRGLRYPKWQVTDDGRLLPGLAKLGRELPGGPWSIYRFLTQPHGELGGNTGLEALKTDRVRQVLDVARGISQGTFA
jgi:hypothetical protein